MAEHSARRASRSRSPCRPPRASASGASQAYSKTPSNALRITNVRQDRHPLPGSRRQADQANEEQRQEEGECRRSAPAVTSRSPRSGTATARCGPEHPTRARMGSRHPADQPPEPARGPAHIRTAITARWVAGWIWRIRAGRGGIGMFGARAAPRRRSREHQHQQHIGRGRRQTSPRPSIEGIARETATGRWSRQAWSCSNSLAAAGPSRRHHPEQKRGEPMAGEDRVEHQGRTIPRSQRI